MFEKEELSPVRGNENASTLIHSVALAVEQVFGDDCVEGKVLSLSFVLEQIFNSR